MAQVEPQDSVKTEVTPKTEIFGGDADSLELNVTPKSEVLARPISTKNLGKFDVPLGHGFLMTTAAVDPDKTKVEPGTESLIRTNSSYDINKIVVTPKSEESGSQHQTEIEAQPRTETAMKKSALQDEVKIEVAPGQWISTPDKDTAEHFIEVQKKNIQNLEGKNTTLYMKLP